MKLFIQFLPSFLLFLAAGNGFAAPVIDLIGSKSVPAGKSITIPITASSPEGRPLTYTVTSTTNRITVEMHTNNPFWKMSVVQAAASNAPGAFLTSYRGGARMVTNVGDMTFLLLRDRAPRTVDNFAALTTSGFYNSNTIFHRVVAGPFFIIQGGDPNTNGLGGPGYDIDDEFHPRSLYSTSGQLGTANSGPDTVGSQFFITAAPQREFDLRYTIFGQLLRGYNVMSNVLNTATDANSRPLAEVIITHASLVPNFTDTAITITGTNLANVAGMIRVIADDGAGGRTTNTFPVTTVADTYNDRPIIYPNTVTNLTAPVNTRLTNLAAALDLEGQQYFWFPYFANLNSLQAASNSAFGLVNGQLRCILVPATNYSGHITMDFYVSSVSNWAFYFENLPRSFWPTYDVQRYQFAVGDTPIRATATNFTAPPRVPFTNQLLATFTNGLPASAPTNFTAHINWGDNSLSLGTVSSNAAGRKEVRGTHTYTNSGSYPIYITLSNRLGAVSTVVSTGLIAPSLSFARTGSSNTLRWPAWAFDYVVQSHTNLATANWVNLTNRARLIGYDNVLTNSSPASNAFFRLKR